MSRLLGLSCEWYVHKFARAPLHHLFRNQSLAPTFLKTLGRTDSLKLNCRCLVTLLPTSILQWKNAKFLKKRSGENLSTPEYTRRELGQNLNQYHSHVAERLVVTAVRKLEYLVNRFLRWILCQDDHMQLFSESDKKYQYPGDHQQRGGSDQEGQSNNQKSPPPEDPNQFTWPQLIPLVILAAIYFMTAGGDPVPETSWQVFYREMLSTGEVERLDVSTSRDRVYVYLLRGAVVSGREVDHVGPHYSFTIPSVESFEAKLREVQEELGVHASEFVPVKYRPQNELLNIALNALTSILIFGGIIWYLIYSRRAGGGRGVFGGNPLNTYIRAKTTVIEPGGGKGISFHDVAGMREAKQEVMEFVEYLQSPKRFTDLGAKIPKGALLVGPPGTGKTLLAKAVATESNVPFLSMAGSDFVEMFAGVGSARVRDLFSQARKRAPCIVYIDEVDAIGRSRRSSSAAGGNSEQENTLNQLLVEMDGVNTIEGVVMLASTNRVDILDQALLRPGRFDRMINIDLPTMLERKEIFEIYLRNLILKKGIQNYAKRLAELTPGKSGADIANICNEAALHAARLNKSEVDEQNFEYAVERVIAGMEKRSNPLSPEERKVIAFHEAGHALLGWMLKHSEPVLKISITPRTNAMLGFTQKLPSDIKLYTNEQLFDMMCTALGGRVAEAVIFKRITTGAEDDLRTVTQMAYRQIVTYGMNEKVGPISFPLKRSGELSRKPYSDKLARQIDEEVSKLVSGAVKQTEKVVQEHKEKLITLAKALMERETVNYDDLVQLLGPSPHGDKRRIHSIREEQRMLHLQENSSTPS